jgi:hypothetical protein
MQKIPKLSAEAIDELRTIYEKQFDEVLREDEAQEMGFRLLRLFSILEKSTELQERPRHQPNERERKALDYIETEKDEGRFPTMRGIAKAVGFKSSRSGHKMLKSLVMKNLVCRNNQGSLSIVNLSMLN